MLFGKQKEGEVKLSGPKAIPEPVRKYLVNQQKKDPALLANFKAVMRSKKSNGGKAFDIRLFDESEAMVKEVIVKDYTTLDEHQDLLYYEGWFDDKSKQVQLEQKKELKPKPEVPIFTETEIRQKIEGLSAPGSTVFFYLAGSPKHGGPLDRGAAIVELNPNYPEGKQKKYNIYVANVDGLEPVSKKEKMFDTDKAKDVSNWIKDKHYKPLYR